MSYEPLHHKYRPKSFGELVGQEAIATTLTNAILSAKIAPAYLLTGPRGTGKTSSARILAKSLNCQKTDKPTPEPCGVCQICQGISKGFALDVIEIDAASNTGVDNIRELIEKAQFAPVKCRYKVYVIDECHMLSTAAFNALLKTLEEPPNHVVFILATTDPQRVLPTIISRCQRFDFRRIQLEAMVKHLRKIATNENINISEDALILVAQLSQGGLRDAESLLDQLGLFPDQVTPEQVWDLVGSVSEKDLFTLLEAIAQDNPEIVLDATRKILDRGREPLIILQNLASSYRDLLIAKTAPKRQDLVACTQSTWKALVEFAHKLDITTILRGQQHLRSAEVQLKNSTQPRLWLEVTLLGLLPSANIQVIQTTNTNIPLSGYSQPPQNQPQYQQPQYQPPQNQPQYQQPQYQPPQNQPATNTETNATQTANNSNNDLTQTWQQVINHIPQLPTKTLLNQMCHLLEFNGTTAIVGVKPIWYDKVKSYLPNLHTAFQQTFQKQIQVTLEKATAGTTNNRSNRINSQPSQNPQPQNSQPQNYVSSPSTNYSQPTEQPQVEHPPIQPQVNKIEPEVIKNNPEISQPIEAVQPIQPINNINSPPVSATINNSNNTNNSNNWDSEQVMRAAENLAKFFYGEVISYTDDSFQISDHVTHVETLEVYDSYEDD
ncbi:DNA polymerase III subunit gamma/tau [Anabaena sp. FACHB-1237]|uniref:DNA polymerase III subunit gamma/tau n=1 Tax=Anabaena sp. FACHB-1237 TaxID=2692769 RepID=UPI001681737F|nr:DNA polymerase III subunit gamma/tau [Anabaena sp. FACHB-1237]MBD2136788.1 DNA polymerase III subunit gamma/tau [Anabaena sp. FACHB-1237]